jgi:hypothetical protein
MTITTLAVLMAALAEHENGPARTLARDGQAAAGREPSPVRAGVTCAMRVVPVVPTFDAGILAPRPRQLGEAVVENDPIVRDSVSPCAAAVGRRASRPGTGER